MTSSPEKPTRRRAITILAAAAAGALIGGPARSSTDYRWTGVAMGADATILFNGIDRDTARAAIELVEAEIDRLEGALSLFRPDSELCRLNRDRYLQSPGADLKAVDLPQPLGPNRETNSPGAIWNDRPSSAWVPPAFCVEVKRLPTCDRDRSVTENSARWRA